jgi:hypothetical protein
MGSGMVGEALKAGWLWASICAHSDSYTGLGI